MLRDCYWHTLIDSKKIYYPSKNTLVHTQKQFKILEKYAYRTSHEICEAFVGIDDDLTINDDEVSNLLNVRRCMQATAYNHFCYYCLQELN